MSDELSTKTRTRSPINAIKVLNTLRAEKGLDKVALKPKAPEKKKVSKEEKAKLAIQVWKDLYPTCDTVDFILPEGAQAKVIAEYGKRLKALLGEAPVGRKPPAKA
jgi:hypothetical protein